MTDIGTSRRQWIRAFWVLAGAFVIVLGALFYATTNRNVSYAVERPQESQADLDVAVRMLAGQQPTWTRANVLRVLRRQNPTAKIFATDSTVTIGKLTFRFDRAGRLEEVTHPATLGGASADK
jgi:hypothetical protein